MAYQGINPLTVIPFRARRILRNEQLGPAPEASADGFEIWWQKNSAAHKDIVAQASAIVCAHRRVSLADEGRERHGH